MEVIKGHPIESTPDRALVWAVRNFYDTQKLRLAVEARRPKKGKAPELKLDPGTIAFNKEQVKGLKSLEKDAEKRVAFVVKSHPMYPWLSDIRGIGPMISALCVVEFDPYKARHASSFKSYAGLGVIHELICESCGDVKPDDGEFEAGEACGCESVVSREVQVYPDQVPPSYPTEEDFARYRLKGRCAKPEKGQSLPYNRFIKTKLIAVFGGGVVKQCLTKTGLDAPDASSPARKREGWVRYGPVDHYTPLGSKKKADELVEKGELKMGKNVLIFRPDSRIVEDTIRVMNKKTKKWAPKKVYYECHKVMAWVPPEGQDQYIRVYLDEKIRLFKKGWGNSNAHRDAAAVRKMVQKFLCNFWVAWRTQLGLPVSKPYEEAILDDGWRAAHGYAPLNKSRDPFRRNLRVDPETSAFI